jgi:hypothetical protein
MYTNNIYTKPNTMSTNNTKPKTTDPMNTGNAIRRTLRPPAVKSNASNKSNSRMTNTRTPTYEVACYYLKKTLERAQQEQADQDLDQDLDEETPILRGEENRVSIFAKVFGFKDEAAQQPKISSVIAKLEEALGKIQYSTATEFTRNKYNIDAAVIFGGLKIRDDFIPAYQKQFANVIKDKLKSKSIVSQNDKLAAASVYIKHFEKLTAPCRSDDKQEARYMLKVLEFCAQLHDYNQVLKKGSEVFDLANSLSNLLKRNKNSSSNSNVKMNGLVTSVNTQRKENSLGKKLKQDAENVAEQMRQLNTLKQGNFNTQRTLPNR